MKNILKVFVLLIIISIFQACSFSKVSTLAKGGSVENVNFNENIPFDYYRHLIFIEVEIDGEMYNFFFDSVAELNVIGKHIADKVSYKSLTEAKVSGSSKGKTKANFVELEQMKIGDIVFNNTGSIIMELKHLEDVLGCKKVDGIIGNNLMRKAVWQINYDKQEIIITDRFENLMISDNAQIIKMEANSWGNIYLDGKLNGIDTRLTFDTGFAGKIKSNKKKFDKLIAKNEKVQWSKEYGMTGANITGISYGKMYNTLIDSLEIEGNKLNNIIISLEEESSSLVGNKYFENFIISMDWANDYLYFDPVKEIEADTLRGFDVIIHPNYKTDKTEIARVRNDFDISLVEPLLTEIIEINGEIVSEFSKQEFCDYWLENKERLRKSEVLELTLIREGKKELLSFERKVILPKL